MPLATIQKIDKLTSIENADNIETAHVLGWEVVVKKGEFKEGDFCIYIEIDSLLPRTFWSQFLFKHDEDTVYRLRTVKLRGQISQGLIVDVYSTLQLTMGKFSLKVGKDVTDELGIKKYEKSLPLNMRCSAKGNFPYFLKKTDEDRIQSVPDRLDKLRGKPYYITTKMDGTSATYYKYKGKFGVCSRNLELRNPNTPMGFFQYLKREIRKIFGKTKKSVPPTNLYWKMAEKYQIEDWLEEGYAVQGEICGPGIQKNPLNLPDHEFYIFNSYDINEKKYIYPFTENPSFDFVPLEEKSDNFDYTQEELLVKAKGKYLSGKNKEGIVVRSLDQTISFKVVNNEYLLKDEE